jgi:hypothetical protein
MKSLRKAAVHGARDRQSRHLSIIQWRHDRRDRYDRREAIVLFLSPDAGGTPLLSDSVGNPYFIPSGSPTPVDITSIRTYCVYVLAPLTSATHNWTISGTSCTIQITVITDTATPAYDNSAGNSYFDTTADPGSIAVAANSIVLASISSNRSSGTFAVPSGYTEIDQVPSDGSDRYCGVAFKLSPSSTEDPTWAATGFQGGCFVLSLKPGGGGGGTPLRFNSLLNGLGGSGGFFRNPLG